MLLLIFSIVAILLYDTNHLLPLRRTDMLLLSVGVCALDFGSLLCNSLLDSLLTYFGHHHRGGLDVNFWSELVLSMCSLCLLWVVSVRVCLTV